ncbi:MAG TPA: hypothetical protein VE262_22975 [Blastocatellia bacterium]|nr:hypothetical protein [Blastocatellia bacterium]
MVKLSTLLILVFGVFAGGLVALVNPPFLSQPSPAQGRFKEPGDDLDEFVGNVKSIDVEIEKHRFTTHVLDFGSLYKRKLFQTSHFDRDGKKIEGFDYRMDGVPLPKTTYSYDKNGVLLKENHYSAVSGRPYYETVYIYDSQGRLKEEVGKSIEDGRVLSRRLYSHDEKGNYTEVVEYDSDNALRGKIGFIWNDRSKVDEVIGFSPEGEVMGKQTITYDEKGNIAGIVFYPSDGSSVEMEKRTYEVDEQGNWVKKTLYYWVTKDGESFYELMNITYRTIAYY